MSRANNRTDTSRRRKAVALRRRLRIHTARPRLSVFRSAKNIYCQVVDDADCGVTVANGALPANGQAKRTDVGEDAGCFGHAVDVGTSKLRPIVSDLRRGDSSSKTHQYAYEADRSPQLGSREHGAAPRVS